MPNPAWPASLPQFFDRNGFERAPADEIDRTEMDSGPAKQRRNSRGGAEAIRGNLFLRSTAQYQDFREFVETTLNGATLEFDWVDPGTQEPVAMRFVKMPTYTKIGQRNLANCELEILP